MKKIFITSLLVLFSTIVFAQSGGIQIYDKFYMNQVSSYPYIGEEYKKAGYFLLKIKLDRTGRTCASRPYFNSVLGKYVFPLQPNWDDVRINDTFTITIEYDGNAQIVGFLAYAGLSSPKYNRMEFTAKASAPMLSGISQGIPIVSLKLSIH